jgi:hypothetical protein
LFYLSFINIFKGAYEISEKYNIIIYNRNMPVYAILLQGEEVEDGVKLLPKYFNTYNDALAEVKRKFPDWDDRYEDDGSLKKYQTSNKVEVGEGHKADGTFGGDINLTELYIERGNHISIRRLVKKKHARASAAAAGGGYSRRRHSKRNTKNSRKHRI